MTKFDDLKNMHHKDTEGRDRSVIALERIANSFPDWGACKVAESYRGWLDDNKIEAESDTGWLSMDACRDAMLQDFILEYQQGEGE